MDERTEHVAPRGLRMYFLADVHEHLVPPGLEEPVHPDKLEISFD